MESDFCEGDADAADGSCAVGDAPPGLGFPPPDAVVFELPPDPPDAFDPPGTCPEVSDPPGVPGVPGVPACPEVTCPEVPPDTCPCVFVPEELRPAHRVNTPPPPAVCVTHWAHAPSSPWNEQPGIVPSWAGRRTPLSWAQHCAEAGSLDAKQPKRTQVRQT
ncbi:hypothetical protein C8J57DRAFT_1717747 [Mycena rebaudengoi]|nr:hypothetical protein C8J57DRAFT_1717747 [Mycena rebaudengoi]